LAEVLKFTTFWYFPSLEISIYAG